MPQPPLVEPAPHCSWCETQSFPFKAVVAGGLDEGVMAQTIRLAKQGGWFELYRLIAQTLAEQLQGHPLWREVNCLVPVPTTWWRRWRRGFDPAEELARELSQLTGKRWCRALQRRGLQRSQTTRSRRARLQALKHVFQERGGQEGPVALVDDLMTTGATLSEAGRALQERPLMALVGARRA